MAEATRRCIISYKQEVADFDYAATILGVETRNMHDGMAIMIRARPMEQETVLHFEALGSTVVMLPENRIEQLKQDERVTQIIEDQPVFALGMRHPGNGADGSDDPADWLPSQSPEFAWYMAGYRQAIIDMMADHAHSPDQLFRSRSSFVPHLMPRPLLRVCPPGQRFVAGCVPMEDEQSLLMQPIPWNIHMINAHRVWQRVTGHGVKVAILDTGIDADHPDLSVSGGVSFVEGVTSWRDDAGHGSHCAGIVGARNNPIGVVGVAPECELYAVKVLNSQGNGMLSWVLAGMDWARREGMHVASMSLGHDAVSADAPFIVAYQRAARQLVDQGCSVVAASGNSGDTDRPWVGHPARCPELLAVGAVDRNKQLADFSSNGPSNLCAGCGVELVAPGVSIRSTWPHGDYRHLSGTSMACPHVSGAVALLKQLHPLWTPAEIRSRLKATASDLGAPGNDPRFGAGLLDCYQAIFG